MQKLKLEIKSLEKKLKEEEEKLRKLKMVKLYRSKVRTSLMHHSQALS